MSAQIKRQGFWADVLNILMWQPVWRPRKEDDNAV